MRTLGRINLTFPGSILAVFLLLFAVQLRSEPEMYFFHNDHLGTPLVLTDKDQNVVWKANYDPFGNAEIVVEQVEMPLRMPGQYYDKETGYLYNGYRYYDAQIGYLKADPRGILLDFSDPQRQIATMMGVPIYANGGMGGLNHSYGYANQNPLNFTDPTGETPAHALRGALWAGGRIGAGINYGVQAALGVSLGVALHDALNGSIPIDVNNPRLPGWVEPTGAETRSEDFCPNPPPDHQQNCFEKVNNDYAWCRATVGNPAFCMAKRVLGMLACVGKPGDGGGASSGGPSFEG